MSGQRASLQLCAYQWSGAGNGGCWNQQYGIYTRPTRASQGTGCRCRLLVFPYYNKPNPHGLEAHVRASLDVGLPLVIYHVPGRTGQRLPFAQLAHLANLEGVVAVKEATGDVHYGINLMSQTDTPVLSGDDFTFLALQCMGGRGDAWVLKAPSHGPNLWFRRCNI